MEAADKSILRQQMKFVLRLQTNDYLNKFLINSRIIENNSGMLGRVITILKLRPDCSLGEINNQIEKTLNEMNQDKKDRFIAKQNETVQRVKKLFELKNAYLRTYSLV